jgi:hypothetical protein
MRLVDPMPLVSANDRQGGPSVAEGCSRVLQRIRDASEGYGAKLIVPLHPFLSELRADSHGRGAKRRRNRSIRQLVAQDGLRTCGLSASFGPRRSSLSSPRARPRTSRSGTVRTDRRSEACAACVLGVPGALRPGAAPPGGQEVGSSNLPGPTTQGAGSKGLSLRRPDAPERPGVHSGSPVPSLRLATGLGSMKRGTLRHHPSA